VTGRLTSRRVEQALARRVERRVVRPLQYGFFDRRPRAHFIHVGKAGGTALKETLAAHLGESRYDIVLHTHPFSFGGALPGEKVFCVLRDPLERFVSAFNYRLREGRPYQYAPWTSDEALAYAAFATPDALGCALSSEDPRIRARAHSAMVSIRHVRDSYWRWFDSSEYMRSRIDDLLLIMWLPDLSVTLPRLLELLGLPDSINMRVDEAQANRSPEGVGRQLSDAAVRNLRLWYGADYALVDYCATLPCFAGPSYHPGAGSPTQRDAVGHLG